MTKKHNVQLLHFQNKFVLYILAIGILVAFSLHSLTEHRIEWAIGWGIVSIIAFFFIQQYQERKIKKIYGEHLLAKFSIREFTPMTGGGKTDACHKKLLQEKLSKEIADISNIKRKTRGKRLSVSVCFYLFKDPKQYTRYNKDIDNMLKIFCDVLSDYSNKDKTILGIGLIEEDHDHIIFEVNAVKKIVKHESQEGMDIEISEWVV